MTKKLFVVLVVISAMLISFSLLMAAKRAQKGTPEAYVKQTIAQKQTVTPMPKGSLPEPLSPVPLATGNQSADRVIGFPFKTADPGDILWCCPAEEGTDDQILGCEALNDTIYITGAGGTTTPDPNYVYAWLSTGTDVCTYLYKHPQPTGAGWGWRDIACDGQFLYASDSYTLECFYMTPGALVPVPANDIPNGPLSPWRAVAYDAGRDAFWTASFSSPIYCVDRSGAVVAGPFANTLPLYGMAYDGTYLWCHSQDNTKAYQFDVNSGTYTGVVYAGCQDETGGIAGGLSLLDVDEGKQTLTLIGITQGTPDALYAMEIEVGGGPIGCCQLTGSCDMITEDECNTAGGTWYASPYECIANVCQIPVDTICHLQWDNGSATWFASIFATGDQQGNYFDPEDMCDDCGPDVYPFLITQISGLMYDHAGVGFVDVIFHFYAVGDDTCSGPGAEIYSFPATITDFYGTEFVEPLPEVLCLEEDFILTVELTGTEGTTPCLLWTNEPSMLSCISWIWHHTYSPPWYAMEDFWSGIGYHMLRVDGVCNSGACVQGVVCDMMQGSGVLASYFGSFGVEDGVAKYYDPEEYCTPPVYPYRIADVEVALYDFAGTGTADIEVAIYIECQQPCDGPGTEIYRSDPFTVTTMYPSLAHIDIPDVVCIYEPFFVGIHYAAGVQGEIPSVGFDNAVCDTCHAWAWLPTFGMSPPWIEWYDLWTPPTPGNPMIYVSGYTEDPACDPPPCGVPLEKLAGGIAATYYWDIPDAYGDDFFNERFEMPPDHGGRLESFQIAFYQTSAVGTPDPDFYVWLSDGLFPLDNNPPYQAIADFHITYGDIVWYPGYTSVQAYSHAIEFDPGEQFHIGYSHADQVNDVLATLSDDGSAVSDRSSEWWGMWGTMLDDWGLGCDFLIDAFICPFAPEGSTFTMQCAPSVAFGTPGDVDVDLYDVTIGAVLGYNLNVDLSLLSPPTGISATFVPNGQPAPYDADVLITITVSPPVPYDDYTLTFQGVGTDGQTKTCDVTLRVQPPYDEGIVNFNHGFQRTSTFGAVGNDVKDNFVWYGTNYLFDGSIISAVAGDPQRDHFALDIYDCEHVGFIPTQHLVITDEPWCPGGGIYEEYYGEVAYSNFYTEEDVISCEYDSLFVIGLKHVDCTDFSIKIKIYYNPTDTDIPELWIALFEDWDIGNAYNNWVDMDPEHNLVWQYDPLDPNFVFGIFKAPFYNEPMHSIRGVNNAYYVWPNAGFCTPDAFDGLDSLWYLMTTAGYYPPYDINADSNDMSLLMVPPPFPLLADPLSPFNKHIEIWIDFGRNLGDGMTWEQWYHKILRYAGFYRGDVNASDTLELPALDISDLVYLINYLYKGGPAPLPFADQGNVDGKGPLGGALDLVCPKNNVDVQDVVYLLNYIYKNGPPPVDYVRFIEQYWSRESLFLQPNW